MILLFAEHITPRLRYIANYMLEYHTGLQLNLTDSVAQFIESNTAKINYSHRQLGEGLHITPATLLFEADIKNQKKAIGQVTVSDTDDVSFFHTDSSADIPFDIFAAGFYLLSRYEEYLPYTADSFGRFPHTESLAYQHRFLHIPVVNQWMETLCKKLCVLYPFLNDKIKKRQYQHLDTIDIDNAFAFRHKNVWRTTGALLQELFKGKITDFVKRVKVLSHITNDPYDTYDFLQQWHEQNNVRPIYFFLAGRYGKYDKNISPRSKTFAKLVQRIANYADIGIHPSFRSNGSDADLMTEHKIMNLLTDSDIRRSRQHFIMLTMPRTYRRLVAIDITDDYSMGYPSHTGFRASVCTPFPFYDLQADTASSLTVHPFAVMDATLLLYMHLTPSQAATEIQTLKKQVQAANGTLISIWHNESLSGQYQWAGWQEVYKQLFV